MQHTGKKESKEEIWKNEKKKRSTRNLLEEDSNPDPQNQLEFRVKSSFSLLIGSFQGWLSDFFSFPCRIKSQSL